MPRNQPPSKRVNNTSRTAQEGIDFFEDRWAVLYFTYYCPWCTWFRVRKNMESWEKRIVEHPQYGYISNIDLFYKDVYHHDCEQTAKARERIGVDRHVRYDPNGKRTDKSRGRMANRRPDHPGRS